MPKDIYLESRVLSADPVELIHILYEHALLQVESARAALAAGDILGRAQAVTKTLAIIGELEGSLDHSSGGVISQNLAKLYQYMRRRLADGNMKRDAEALAEVESLMQTLAEGWSAMRPAATAPLILPYTAATTESAAHSWNA